MLQSQRGNAMHCLKRIAGKHRAGLALIGTAGLIGLCFGADTRSKSLLKPPAQFNVQVGRNDWPQLGSTPSRNNAPDGASIPTEWDIKGGKNIKWSAKL